MCMNLWFTAVKANLPSSSQHSTRGSATSPATASISRQERRRRSRQQQQQQQHQQQAHQQSYWSMGRLGLSPPSRHPPVYCVEDLEVPPPSYEPLDWRNDPVADEELAALRERLALLEYEQCREMSSQQSGVPSSPYEACIRSAEIMSLNRWIRGLESESVRLQRQQQQGGWRRRHPRHTRTTTREIAIPGEMERGAAAPHHVPEPLPPSIDHVEALNRFGMPRLVRPPLMRDSRCLTVMPNGRGARSTTCGEPIARRTTQRNNDSETEQQQGRRFRMRDLPSHAAGAMA
jgi:hypothetical protein